MEKDRQDNFERMSKFCQKKSEAQALKDSQARQEALQQLGIKQEFNYADHAAIYRFAGHVEAAPIETVNSRQSVFDFEDYLKLNGLCASGAAVLFL